jgi:hypothetical protein
LIVSVLTTVVLIVNAPAFAPVFASEKAFPPVVPIVKAPADAVSKVIPPTEVVAVRLIDVRVLLLKVAVFVLVGGAPPDQLAFVLQFESTGLPPVHVWAAARLEFTGSNTVAAMARQSTVALCIPILFLEKDIAYLENCCRD